MDKIILALLQSCEFGIIEDIDSEDSIIADAIYESEESQDINISTTVEKIDGKDSLSVFINGKIYTIKITKVDEL